LKRALAVLCCLAPLLSGPVAAHPHIFVEAKATITFDDAGQVLSVHHQWTFDEAYSAWAVQGLDANLDGQVTTQELQPLADDNMEGLSAYDYYTFAGEGPVNLNLRRAAIRRWLMWTAGRR